MKPTQATLKAIKEFNATLDSSLFLETYEMEDWKGRLITLLHLGERDSDLGILYLVNNDGTLSFYAAGMRFTDLPAHISNPVQLKAVVFYALSEWAEDYL